MEKLDFNEYCKLSDDGLKANKEDKMFSNIIENHNRYLSNHFKTYKEYTKNAKIILIETINLLVDEIATLSHCAGMLYKKENYEEYINTVEELKKMLYEKLEEL